VYVKVGDNIMSTKTYVYKGKEKTLKEWAALYSIKYITLFARLNRYGFSIAEALELRPHQRRDQVK